MPAFHGEHGLEGRRRPFAMAGRHLGEHVAHEMHRATLVSRLREHLVDGGDESGAPVADHQAHAFQPAFDHAPDELPPAGGILLHALGHADHLAVALGVDAYGHQDAHVFHRASP
ncbi:hypothetical protein BITS_0732 [Bifidobacterium tsurumiense]|uniref:Uncharacterized protein n=1 Tax=Bifidobacterium tsurumiense TaxID=356829 RepID=A0A087EI81_9BIFI|nr:hypothetical protein BITS_0732 [Bifidobacterium tsurumiense]